MPRQARLDSSGVLHHIISRGIERQALFREDRDREVFLERLEKGIARTKSHCYAWVLMSNHFHLLLRTGMRPVSELMRSLLTGHAVYYNRKYSRHGYLFQNRYKSIICQEDVYFLELVRYIHLNPVRARIVGRIEELDSYPWSGHSVLVGNRTRAWQDKNTVLRRFGKRQHGAVEGYREYIRDGLSMGNRPDLLGGGLIRSAGSAEELERRRVHKEFHLGDERILGDSGFVEELLEQAEFEESQREHLQRIGWTLGLLTQEVAKLFGLPEQELRSRSRRREVSRAKAIVAQIAYDDLRMSGREIGRYLNLSSGAVTQSRQKWGEEVAVIRNNLITKPRP